MRNITVSVSDELYQRARISAACRYLTVTALVRRFLESLDEFPNHPRANPATESGRYIAPSPPFPCKTVKL